jgi:prevent-host-death family protein
MTVATFDSRTARERWGELLDDAATTDIVITRYGRPKAVLIAYEDFEALQDILDDLRAGRRIDALLEEIAKDPSRVVPYAEVRAQLVAEGVLDDEG